MIKIDTNKGKTINFQLKISGGNISEIKQGRFILKSHGKQYGMIFDVTINEDSVIIDIPPLDISDVRAQGILELISNDNQYYEVWKDNVQLSKKLTILVKEDKENPTVILKEETDVKNKTKKKIHREKSLIKSKKIGEKRILYRTIQVEQPQLQKFLTTKKIKFKPQPGKKVKFYTDSSFLVNDLENIDYGICISAKIPEECIIKEFADKLIADSSKLPMIDEKNIIYIIDNGMLKEISKIPQKHDD